MKPSFAASALLRQNIKAILKARNQTAHDLAVWCRMDDSWISKILSDKQEDEKAKGIPIKHLDRIASFFGAEIYELFTPGRSHLNERRSGTDRRSWRDRRLSGPALSEKPGDVDVLSLIRALSTAGRQRALGYLVDLVNDELRGPRNRAPAVDDSHRSAETPRAVRAQTRPK